MEASEYYALADQGFNRVPLTRDILADLETPLSTYLKLARGPYSYLLESVQGGEKWGRYSYIGLPSRERLEVRGHQVRVIRDEQVIEEHAHHADPLAFVEAYKAPFRVADHPGLPRFAGGLVGYFGYDTVRYIEPRLADSCPPDDIGNPDILLMVSDELVVFDNLSGKLCIMVHGNPQEVGSYDVAQQRLTGLVQQLLETPLPHLPLATDQPLQETDFHSHFGEQAYMEAVERIREYTLAGDIMQVVPSQRLSAPFPHEPVHLYRALRSLNPSPYMYFLDLDDHQVVGSSPEILSRVDGDEVTVRPIAGTRHRGQTEEQDQAMEAELLADPKEIAEHLMLIDLGRNDAGRVSEIGSVEVTEQMAVERYSHVMHIVSNVTGRRRADVTAVDVLRATHPAGTLSGAPKIRAMEIIDELEPLKRGIYGGAVGYLGWNDNMDMAIAIRTAVIKNGILYAQAGGGVVADSVPRLEWEETMNKARALFRAAEMVSRGLTTQ
ncbi:anthranilate synthase component I [Natronospirillum operosum]|uniref:Anthranilate synthase component 1 n=1 Tax=Natronospirillum operosum TaxID=2759953 RepID=A0A4Z0WD53_9GAMM|nr:anthranilate synthase component I [Natronospirillum operosum]TGG94960.1 anthranilate synthase component I [Natronospirillum operosum]